MSRLLQGLVISALLLLTSGSAQSVPDAAGDRVVFTQFLHRHGSRSPLPPANASKWCSERGCGLLNEEGKDMLFKLGQMLRDRYDGLNPSYFPSTNYDADAIHTRSTDVLRTILSAEAVLRGIYPNTTNPLTYLPLVAVVPKPTDVLLSSNAVMSYALRLPFLTNSGMLRKLMMPSLLRNFGDPDTNATTAAILNAMAEEVHLQGYCAEKGFSVCLGYVQDVVVSLIAEGKGDAMAPVGTAHVALLNNILRDMNAVFYGYNLATDGVDGDTAEDVKARGSCGQPLAIEMIANFRTFMKGQLPYKIMHYSAHDTTITPFGVTIGDLSLLLTGYGNAVIIDLVFDASGAPFLKGIWGEPEQTPGPHPYFTHVLALGGIDASGNVYHLSSANEKMPFEDFVRFVSNTTAQSKEGYCYLNQPLKDYIDCGLEASPSALCVNYRTNCPQTACPPNSYLSVPSYACVAFPTQNGEANDTKMKVEILAVFLVASLVAGFVIGFIVSYLRRKKHAAATFDPESSCSTLVVS